ncbi:hypothetical protein Chor_001355 [Crotalus horridus]
MELYKEEEEAYWELVTVATEFYQYLLLPFRDMRELATLYRLEIQKSLQAHRLGPKRIEALQKEAKEWTDRAEEAVCSIQNVTVGYFKETVTALAAMHKQMEQDQKRFGQAAWASASPRLENLKYLLAKETLQHMRARELCLKHKRVDIRKQMETLGEQKNDVAQVEKLELEYYETQLELYEVQFEILKNEEMLLVTQLETLRRQIKEIQDEVIYYDTCENSEELEAMDRVLEDSCASSSEVARLRQKTQQLETKRGIICSRRAYLRNKKDQCEESRRLRLQQAQETTRYFQQHHSVQIKREKKKEDEKKKKAWIKEERQKTLERLKSFKEARTMDEVLASLKRGEVLLRKVDLPQQASSSSNSVNDSILAAIRQGVKLRKVNQEPKEGVAKGSGSELEQSIKAAIQRIKKVSADSDEDENGDCSSGEWNC